MDVELLVTGDEITRGAVVDTNSAWLLQRLLPLGARVRRITAVGDVEADLLAAMREGAARTDLLLVSGGLGPTSDDLTADCAARVAGVPLVLDEETLRRIEVRWARRQKPMPAGVSRQAQVPQGAVVLANDEGTAPGFHLKIDRAECFFFAGVPREFKHLCERHLLPFVAARSDRAIVTKTLRFVAVPESELDAAYLDLATRNGLKLGLRAVYPETWASFTAEAPTREAALAQLAPVVNEAIRQLAPRCYTAENETLGEVVGRKLTATGWTVSVAESCTGGLLGAELTEMAGSSRFFMGGALTYSNDEKIRSLGVERRLIEQHGAVSEPVARAMAEGVRVRVGTTCSLSITGIAGPGGGTPEKPVGTVWIAVTTPEGTTAELHRFTRTDRASIRAASVAAALDLLRRAIPDALR